MRRVRTSLRGVELQGDCELTGEGFESLEIESALAWNEDWLPVGAWVDLERHPRIKNRVPEALAAIEEAFRRDFGGCR